METEKSVPISELTTPIIDKEELAEKIIASGKELFPPNLPSPIRQDQLSEPPTKPLSEIPDEPTTWMEQENWERRSEIIIDRAQSQDAL